MKVTDENVQRNRSLVQSVYACQSHLNTLANVITKEKLCLIDAQIS